jgi:hypothetical protein
VTCSRCSAPRPRANLTELNSEGEWELLCPECLAKKAEYEIAHQKPGGQTLDDAYRAYEKERTSA